MKILIAVDMEGISGVTSWEQVTPGHAEYARFRRLMTDDVNAAIQGAIGAGATEVYVADGHWNSGNILIEELDPRAKISTGTPSPFSMVNGIDASYDGAFFVGYHARAGARNAILDHTWSNKSVMNLWINDILLGETGLNAAVCGYFDVPVLLVSGDQTVCKEALDLLGQVEVAVVKQASGRFAAACLPPLVAQEKICEAAARAVNRLLGGSAPRPFHLKKPIRVRIEFHSTDMADRAMLLPGFERPDGRTLTFTAPDMLAAYWTFRSAILVSRE
jgi:D-amino peptidase